MELINRIRKYYMPPVKREPKKESVPITGVINDTAQVLRELFGGSSDLSLKSVRLGSAENGVEALTACVDGLVDKEMIAVSVTGRMAQFELPAVGNDTDIMTLLRRDVITCSDVKTVSDIDEAAALMLSGFVCVFLHGCKSALAVGVQGFSFRSVDEPQTEVLQRGSREGFSEPIKINQTLLRRRLKTPDLVFESLQLGKKAKTDISLCYLKSTVGDGLVEKVKERLSKVRLDTVFTSGCLVEFLDEGRSVFNGVGVTERPDVACAKLCEGKVAIMVDGTPSVLIVPHLMVENFSTLDDYSDKTYFAAMTRQIKYAAFFIAVFLPGVYVALASYSPEFFPAQLLIRVTTSVSKTPFSAFAEILLFTFIYEIMREAGLRLPKTLGHAVSIIGGLVIGDTAVSSGFIGAPTLMIVALTVICSYVIPELYAPISILRFLFIIAGGVWGIWGIMLTLCALAVDLCSKESFGEKFMRPIAPLDPFSLRDVVIRAPWKVLQRQKSTEVSYE